MRLIFPALSLFLLASPALAASSTSPNIALPLAALVGEHDPALPPGDKTALKVLLDGHKPAGPGRAAIVVTARSILCRASNVAIAERSCELDFGSHKATLAGRAAHELDATLTEAGAQGDGAVGTIFTGVSKLRCSVTPAVVLDHAGGGAECGFAPAQ